MRGGYEIKALGGLRPLLHRDGSKRGGINPPQIHGHFVPGHHLCIHINKKCGPASVHEKCHVIPMISN